MDRKKVMVLPETVQNKIAAGEVVESPASVVKELVENSLDAGAKRVSIQVEEGGHRLIRVADDGSGMDEADLVAAMQRHATSKIRNVEDIFDILTFGFRGEALPSVGSVSRMTVITGLGDGEAGRELLMEGGGLVRVAPAQPRKGTLVEVRDLFYNTPARRNFMRSPGAETTQIVNAVIRLALGNPDIAFRLQAGEKISLSVGPAATQIERYADLYGRELAGRMASFSSRISDGLSVRGFFAKPPQSHKNSSRIFILVNQRWIKNFGLARVLADAFQGSIPARCYPYAVLNVTVDPKKVDVNVHPAKEEIRFDDEKGLMSGTRRAVREALAKSAQSPVFHSFSEPPKQADPDRRPFRYPVDEPPAPDPEDKPDAAPAPSRGVDVFSREKRDDFSKADLRGIRERMQSVRPEPPESPGASAPSGRPAAGAAGNRNARGSAETAAAGNFRILGQFSGKYIAVDCPSGLVLIDPHALHERWNYDRLLEARRAGSEGRQLLLPLRLDLSPGEAYAAEEALPALAEYGFACSLPEPNRLIVSAIPAFMRSEKVEALLRDVLADAGEARETVESARERLLASLACRASVLLGMSLPEEEVKYLVDSFVSHGQMPTCPHGRPTAILIDTNDLKKRFGR